MPINIAQKPKFPTKEVAGIKVTSLGTGISSRLEKEVKEGANKFKSIKPTSATQGMDGTTVYGTGTDKVGAYYPSTEEEPALYIIFDNRKKWEDFEEELMQAHSGNLKDLAKPYGKVV